MAMTLDEALLTLNDRLGQEVTTWVEVVHETPLLIATGLLENWVPDDAEPRYDRRGRYAIADVRLDLSNAPVDSVGERADGLTFRFEGGARLVVTWTPTAEGDFVQ